MNNFFDTFLSININCLRIMSISITKKSNVDSDVVISQEEYIAIADEESTSNKKYSKVGHLYPEKIIPQFQWFKGSRDRGLHRDLAA